ncbi:MAG TPA: tRNA (adenosine(37)-N6)-dimethylallyltransferase MiaA [Limnochordia bacterium]|nr:tRNA (adenosine(37)-N6)-dimethylallyltransferase MiaA [Limnochordia bacterium]
MVQQKVLVILGPTAVGKTTLSLEIASELGGEILSADSMQVYRGMDIGTAKPGYHEKQRVTHHLLDVVYPNEPFNVADYVSSAEGVLVGLRERGKVPLLSGGTGLYIDALLKGFLFPDASANEEIRARLQAQAAVDPVSLYERLKEIDPPSAKKLHPNDLRRVIRALEVYDRTGESMSSLQRKLEESERPYQPLYIGLNRDREELYARVGSRVDAMIDEGLIDEVQLLLRAYPNQPTALQALGYKEIAYYLRDQMTLPDAIELLKRDTRRYAKRQLSWFKRNKDIHWFNCTEMPYTEIEANIHSLWEAFCREPS